MSTPLSSRSNAQNKSDDFSTAHREKTSADAGGDRLRAAARGSIMGLLCGDALGAAVEGFPPDEIRRIAQSHWKGNLFQDFILAVPMGTFVPAGSPAKYRPATGVNDVSFVPTGPPTNEAVAEQCARFGCYTDDGNASLALAAALEERQGRVDAAHCALRCAEFFRDNERYRGCPPTAKRVQEATLQGAPVQETGLPPYFGFPGGSFANGGAMRISPLAVTYLRADAPTLRQAATAAVLGSHRHPEAVDFAVVQAAAVQYALRLHVSVGCGAIDAFDSRKFLSDLAERCETECMRSVITGVAEALCRQQDPVDAVRCPDNDYAMVESVVRQAPRPGSGMGFQIASVHMAPCVLWCVCRHYTDPRRAVQAAIDLGGDTDTTAAMVGAIVGALHGEQWCDAWAAQLENGPSGRDYALGLADALAALEPGMAF